MEIRGKDILVLGGWGLVGMALCRKLIAKGPKSITISSLTQEQAESACQELSSVAGSVRLYPAWGDIFVRSELKDFSRHELLENHKYRLKLIEDVLEGTTETSFSHFFLHELITQLNPHIIIDCVNSATGLAYQDVYSAGLKVLQGLHLNRNGENSSELLTDVEKLLTSLYLPQLVRHVQVLYSAMKEANTLTYVKVGTSGTGGMGLNIPYTHSEDKPSRVLLTKSSVAGAHSLLLFLMGRTPDAPYTKEVKPATAIAWKSIQYGEVMRRGKPIPLVDCNIDQAETLSGTFNVENHDPSQPTGENLKGVFIDTGENGTFSLAEFTAITTHEQMEYITPEEIAQTVVWEIEGGATGHDVVAALDASVLGPTYRAGVMRSLAIDKMSKLIAENGTDTVAFELLGPPRLSKLLYEANILKSIAGSINKIIEKSADQLAEDADKLIENNRDLRSRIISIGIPILMSDGKKLLRGSIVKVPNDPRKTEFELSNEALNAWTTNGWVDLRPQNMQLWLNRLNDILEKSNDVDSDDTSSHILRNREFWHLDDPLDEGEVVGWIFIHEDEGRRMK